MKLAIYLILMLASTAAIASGDEYSHRYDTFEIGFSTPPQIIADVQWNTETPGMKIMVDLSTGESVFAFRHIFSTWQSRDATRSNLEKLWTSYSSGNGHTTPTVSELNNGDFLVIGRMMDLRGMITRTMRTFDFNKDGRLDFIIIWNGNGSFDYELLNYLASTTKINLIQSKVNSTTEQSIQKAGKVRADSDTFRHEISRWLQTGHADQQRDIKQSFPDSMSDLTGTTESWWQEEFACHRCRL